MKQHEGVTLMTGAEILDWCLRHDGRYLAWRHRDTVP
jgi:hypothetical protein